MNKGPSTEASHFLQDFNQKDVFEDSQNKKISDPLLTPQRKDETLRKQYWENKYSKTDDKKKSYHAEARIQNNFSLRNALFCSYGEKQIKYTGCNCRKSQCLKMYCTCFAVGKMCDETCLCDSCKNDHDNMDRSQAINEIIEKDPFAFSKKADSTNLAFDDDACNCRKSNCTKKYCDCYRRGKVCGSKCNCSDCNNTTNHSDLQKNSDSQPKKKLKFQ